MLSASTPSRKHQGPRHGEFEGPFRRIIPAPEKGQRYAAAHEHGMHALRHFYASVLAISCIYMRPSKRNVPQPKQPERVLHSNEQASACSISESENCHRLST